MRHSQRTSPAVVALLLALGADARVGLAAPGAPNNIAFPDALTAGATKWGISGGNQYFCAANLATGGDGGMTALTGACTTAGTTTTTYLAYASYTGTQGSCVDCIRSQQVWCSKYYLAETAETAYAVPVTMVAGDATPTARSGTPKTAYSVTAGANKSQDLGSCCFPSKTWWNTNKDDVAVIGKFANKIICPSKYTNDGGAAYLKNGDAFGATATGTALAAVGGGSTLVQLAFQAGADNDTSWWCSDGTAPSSATAELAYIERDTAKFVLATNGVAAGTSNALFTNDPRDDIFLTACRQNSVQCGGDALVVPTGGVMGVSAERKVQSTFVYSEKCTWLLKSGILGGAPTFHIKTATTTTGNVDGKWDLHYMEYSNEVSTNMPTMVTSAKGIGAAKANAYPLSQTSAYFAELKGRLYDRTAYAEHQVAPFVWAVADYAGSRKGVTSVYQNKKRYFSPTVAEKEIADYKLLSAEFTRLKGIYDPLKTKYDEAGEARKKCFADAVAGVNCWELKFPARPTLPTVLAGYTGLRAAQHSATKDYTFAAGATLPDTMTATTGLQANEFVVDGGYGGGWGAWTMGLHTIKQGLGKSFGIWGLQEKTATYDSLSFSYSQKQSHMCLYDATASSTTNQITVPADKPTFCKSGTQVAAQISATQSILAVSIWANDATAAYPTNDILIIDFKLSAWKDHSGDWAAPAAPSPAVACGTFGAQALAVSAAAAAAVAAALY